MFWVKEDLINETAGHSFGGSDWYETSEDSLGSLFKDFQREYGRCTSRMYVDRDNGPWDGPRTPIQVGWVFAKKMVYEDAERPYREFDYYTREAWIQVSTTKPEREVRVNNVTSPWMGKT
jgi:hypothetical protein